MRTVVAFALSVLSVAPAAATEETLKFVGTWEGISGRPIFTKLVFHPDETTTYCYVQNCRQMNCWKMEFEETASAVLRHSSVAGDWEFTRLSDDEIHGKFTNAAGEVSHAVYLPE